MSLNDDKQQTVNNSQAQKGGDNSRKSSLFPSKSSQSEACGASEAVEAVPLQVKTLGNNVDRAIKTLRSIVQKERILSLYKEKQTYEKPSDKKRRKRNEARRKEQEQNRESKQ